MHPMDTTKPFFPNERAPCQAGRGPLRSPVVPCVPDTPLPDLRKPHRPGIHHCMSKSSLYLESINNIIDNPSVVEKILLCQTVKRKQNICLMNTKKILNPINILRVTETFSNIRQNQHLPCRFPAMLNRLTARNRIIKRVMVRGSEARRGSESMERELDTQENSKGRG